MKLFDPRLEVRVFTGDSPSTTPDWANPAKLVRIKDLHMSIDITATINKEPNTCQATIYNLSPATRATFSQEHQGIEAYVGYKDADLTYMAGEILNPLLRKDTMIFRGYTANVSHEREGMD